MTKPMTNRLPSLFAGSLASCIMTAAAGTAAVLASETAEQDGFATGAWQITQAIETLEVPGLPAAMVERMAKDPKNAAPRQACNSAASGARPDPALFHALGGTCEWESWQAGNGAVQAVLACAPPGGAPGSARVTVSGTYTADSYALRTETIGRSGAGDIELRLIAQVAGQFSGACTS